MSSLRGRLKQAVCLAALLCCFDAAAQQPTTPQPGRDRPLPEATPAPDLDFTIQAPRRSPVPRAVEELTFDVKDVKITGGTRYGPDVLRPLIQPVIGQTVHLADLIAIAEQIEARYHQDGYVLTRVFVPTQSVNDGIFQITVVEGYVSAVAVQGGDEDSRERVERLLAPVTGARPLTIATLETALLSANKLPGVSAAGLLRPSATEQGASELVVTVRDLPVNGGVSADNMGTASTGRWTVAADATAASPFGDGGTLSLNASADPADPQIRYSAGGKYTAPLPFFDGLTYSLSAMGSHGEPGGSVAAYQLITNSTVFGARITAPLIVSRAEELSLDGGLTIQSSDAKSNGLTATHDEWRVADLALTYQNNVWLDGATTVTLDVAQGLPGLGATPDSSEDKSGQSDFTKFTAQIRRVQPIVDALSASLLVSGQYATVHPVLGEELNFGGQLIGRGYDPGAVTGDMGVGGAFELRYDLNPSWFWADTAQFYGFLDGGEVRNHNGSIAENKIASTGAGLRITIPGNVLVGVMYGKALLGVPGSDEDKRSSRVMLNTAVRF
jgi:hemolysin activation/secretion protein